MFSKLAIFAAATLAVVASAAPAPAGQCNTGPVQCCNSVQDANTKDTQALLGLLGVAVEGITGLVGIGCSPLTVVGLGGNSCSEQPVCCTDNKMGGLVVVGCSPVNV